MQLMPPPKEKQVENHKAHVMEIFGVYVWNWPNSVTLGASGGARGSALPEAPLLLYLCTLDLTSSGLTSILFPRAYVLEGTSKKRKTT
eukprot:584202-Pelagomonas_calceolata.AAC.1